MPKFRVWYEIVSFAFVDVDADTIEEAMDKADMLGGEHFDKTDAEWSLDTDYTYEYNKEFPLDEEAENH